MKGKRTKLELKEILLENHPDFKYGEDVKHLSYKNALWLVRNLEKDKSIILRW